MLPESPPEKDGPEKQRKIHNKNYVLRKRVPRKPVDGDNVVFVTKKSNFKAQLDNCIELLSKGEKEIILHGLGAAIQRTCNLAVQIQIAFPGTHEVEINTDTVDVIDDLIPKDQDLDIDHSVRLQSSVHIRIFRTAVVGAN